MINEYDKVCFILLKMEWFPMEEALYSFVLDILSRGLNKGIISILLGIQLKWNKIFGCKSRDGGYYVKGLIQMGIFSS